MVIHTSNDAKKRRNRTYRHSWTAPNVVYVSGEQADDRWAKYLREVTDRPGWSVARLAREAGMHRSSIFKWLGGKGGVTMASVQAIAAALDDRTGETLRAAGGVLDQGDDVQDPQVAEILVADLPEDIKQTLIETLLDQRARDKERQTEMVRRMIRIAKGGDGEAVG